MKITRNVKPGGVSEIGVLSLSVAAVMILVPASCVAAPPADFYAFYTRLDYDDHHTTGQYADLIANVGEKGRFVFCREFGFLPYWQPSDTKYFVDRILPVTGDGPPERPDKINKCSYVRLIESSPERIVVHWRYAPDLNSPHFTDFQRTYSGDIGSYFADYAEEYFTLTPDGRITRGVKKGCVRLDHWNDPLNVTTQQLELTPSGIAVRSTTPARLGNRPGDAVAGAPVVDGGIRSPALWMRFDEGLLSQDDFTRENVKGSKCAIRGADSYWRRGVSGTCLSFDGYTNRVTVPARELPDIRGDFTPPLDTVPGFIRGRVEAAFSGVRVTDPSHGRVLTDDFNPADFHDAANREALRRTLALSYRPDPPGSRP